MRLSRLGAAGADYPDLTVDGGLGAMSFAAVRAFVAKRGTEGRRSSRFGMWNWPRRSRRRSGLSGGGRLSGRLRRREGYRS